MKKTKQNLVNAFSDEKDSEGYSDGKEENTDEVCLIIPAKEARKVMNYCDAQGVSFEVEKE